MSSADAKQLKDVLIFIKDGDDEKLYPMKENNERDFYYCKMLMVHLSIYNYYIEKCVGYYLITIDDLKMNKYILKQYYS